LDFGEGDVCIRLQEKWRFQEEELTRLTNEVDILLQRRQELQELLSPGKRVNTERHTYLIFILTPFKGIHLKD